MNDKATAVYYDAAKLGVITQRSGAAMRFSGISFERFLSLVARYGATFGNRSVERADMFVR
jgi:hypothetical protein